MPSPRTRPREPRPTVDQQMARRRELILEAARAVIEGEGYEGLSMRSLAAKSGVTVPTIYNLVGNKEDVLFAAVAEQTDAFVASLERTPHDVSAVMEATVRHLTRRPRYYRSLVVSLTNLEDNHRARRLVSRAVERQLEVCIAELAENGALESWIDPRALTERLQAGLDAATLEWARGALTTAGYRAAALYAMALMMIGATRGEARESFGALARDHQGEALRRKRTGYDGPIEGRAA